jgi:hypothetical protein
VPVDLKSCRRRPPYPAQPPTQADSTRRRSVLVGYVVVPRFLLSVRTSSLVVVAPLILHNHQLEQIRLVVYLSWLVTLLYPASSSPCPWTSSLVVVAPLILHNRQLEQTRLVVGLSWLDTLLYPTTILRADPNTWPLSPILCRCLFAVVPNPLPSSPILFRCRPQSFAVVSDTFPSSLHALFTLHVFLLSFFFLFGT